MSTLIGAISKGVWGGNIGGGGREACLSQTGLSEIGVGETGAP